MKYQFQYQVTPFDFWQLSMYGIYRSMAGVCNIIFTAAMILLTAKFWGDVNSLTRVFLLTACCLFLVIQPAVIYKKAKKQAESVPQHMEIGFDDKGIHVKTKDQSSDLKWKSVRGISRNPGMIIIVSAAQHGFILSDKILGEQKEAFYKFAASKIGKNIK